MLKALKQISRQCKLGFTLTELLVVIGILSILSAIGTISYTNLAKNNRDKERQKHLNTIVQALEMFRADYHSYPTTNELDLTSNTFIYNGRTYLSTVPKDPNTEYFYYYEPYTGSALCNVPGSCDSFVVCAAEEGSVDYQPPDRCKNMNCSSNKNCLIGFTSR